MRDDAVAEERDVAEDRGNAQRHDGAHQQGSDVKHGAEQRERIGKGDVGHNEIDEPMVQMLDRENCRIDAELGQQVLHFDCSSTPADDSNKGMQAAKLGGLQGLFKPVPAVRLLRGIWHCRELRLRPNVASRGHCGRCSVALRDTVLRPRLNAWSTGLTSATAMSGATASSTTRSAVFPGTSP